MDGSAGVNDGLPAATRARFEVRLPAFFFPRFGGIRAARIAHAVAAELYQCPIEDFDVEMAGMVVTGALDWQLRGFMLTSSTTTAAQVSEWLCCSMSPALRCATLPSMAMALQRVINAAAAKTANSSGVGIAAAARRAGTSPVASVAPRGADPSRVSAVDSPATPPLLPAGAIVTTVPAVARVVAGSTPASSGVSPVAAATVADLVWAGKRLC